jgi:hypothetical protein
LLLVVVALVPRLPVIVLGMFVAFAMHRAALKAEAGRMPRATSSGPEAS